jgi:hypothetical protein
MKCIRACPCFAGSAPYGLRFARCFARFAPPGASRKNLAIEAKLIVSGYEAMSDTLFNFVLSVFALEKMINIF